MRDPRTATADQLALFVPRPAPPPTDLPPAVAEIVNAARSMAFDVRIVRGHWGIGVGVKRKWVLTGDCCCALAALLVVRGAEAEKEDGSASCAVARTLGIDPHDVYRFVDGYDGQKPDDGSVWFGYGWRVATELGVQ
jgi:hypothetical protein